METLKIGLNVKSDVIAELRSRLNLDDPYINNSQVIRHAIAVLLDPTADPTRYQLKRGGYRGRRNRNNDNQTSAEQTV